MGHQYAIQAAIQAPKHVPWVKNGPSVCKTSSDTSIKERSLSQKWVISMQCKQRYKHQSTFPESKKGGQYAKQAAIQVAMWNTEARSLSQNGPSVCNTSSDTGSEAHSLSLKWVIIMQYRQWYEQRSTLPESKMSQYYAMQAAIQAAKHILWIINKSNR